MKVYVVHTSGNKVLGVYNDPDSAEKRVEDKLWKYIQKTLKHKRGELESIGVLYLNISDYRTRLIKDINQAELKHMMNAVKSVQYSRADHRKTIYISEGDLQE